MKSTPPESSSVTRVCSSTSGRTTMRSSFGGPAQYPAFASSTMRTFLSHDTNLNGPVPTGWLANSLPYFFTAAGLTMRPVLSVRLLSSGENGCLRVKRTVSGAIKEATLVAPETEGGDAEGPVSARRYKGTRNGGCVDVTASRG